MLNLDDRKRVMIGGIGTHVLSSKTFATLIPIFLDILGECDKSPRSQEVVVKRVRS